MRKKEANEPAPMSESISMLCTLLRESVSEVRKYE